MRDSCSDSFSDESSESEKLSRWDNCSSDEGVFEHDNLNHNNVNDRLGCLYFQYFERSTPYARVPLLDKVQHFYALVLVPFPLFFT